MTTPKFLRCYAVTMRWEGEGCHQAAGEDWRTCWGIAERFHPQLFVDGPPTQEAAMEYTYNNWWLSLGLEGMPFALAVQVFDHAFNAGIMAASSLLDRSGPDHEVFFLERLRFYTRPERRNRDLNLAGWINRCRDAYEEARTDAHSVQTLVMNQVPFMTRLGWLFRSPGVDRRGWAWRVSPETNGDGLKLDVRPL